MPAPPAAWPGASRAVVTANAQERIAALIDARADSVRTKADARASDDIESTARGDEPITRVWTAVSLIRPTPMMFLILGLGLAVIGILSRMAMKIAVARRARDNQRQYEWRDNQDEYSSVYEQLSTARDFGPHQAFRARDSSPAGTDLSLSLSGPTAVNEARDKNEVGKRDDTLAQLSQGLDRLLRSEGAGRPLQSRDDGQNTDARSFGASKIIDGQAQGEALRRALGLV